LDRFTQLSKSEANHYTNCKLNVVIDDSLNLTWVEHSLKLNSFDYYLTSQVSNSNVKAALASLNLNNTPSYLGSNRGVLVLNCRLENTDSVAFFGITNNSTNAYFATISNCYIVGEGGIGSNVFFSDGEIKDIVGNVRVRKNTMGGSGSAIRRIEAIDGSFCDVLHNHFNDNSRLEDISVSADGSELYIWDNIIMENCDIANWVVENCGIKFANSRLNNEVNLLNFTFNAPRADLEDYEIYIQSSNNVILQDVTNISINGLSLEYHQDGSNTVDLTGFTEDIIGQTIVDGVGLFTIKRNFSTNPLIVGTPVLFNLIPTNARATVIRAIGSLTGGVGAVLTIGIQGDAPTLINQVVGNYLTGQVVNSFSAAATANRGLQLEALVANVTSGELTVYIEFII